MLSAPIPENDEQRVASLRAMTLLSTPREADFDRVTRIASKLFGTGIAAITLVDKERQSFKSRIGLEMTETIRAYSFCSHAIESRGIFVVRDALADRRFHDN